MNQARYSDSCGCLMYMRIKPGWGWLEKACMMYQVSARQSWPTTNPGTQQQNFAQMVGGHLFHSTSWYAQSDRCKYVSHRKGNPFLMSVCQKINTMSLTKAELVGVSSTLSIVLWTRNFLLEQDFTVMDSVVYQDNQSAILLEKHGCTSSGRRTHHINIIFFITNQIKSGEVHIEYCPTSDMLADFFTKPLQGAQFRKLCTIIMNSSDSDTGELSERQKSHLSGQTTGVCWRNQCWIGQPCHMVRCGQKGTGLPVIQCPS